MTKAMKIQKNLLIFRATVVPGEITGEDLIAVLPFGNTIDRVTMYGRR